MNDVFPSSSILEDEKFSIFSLSRDEDESEDIILPGIAKKYYSYKHKNLNFTKFTKSLENDFQEFIGVKKWKISTAGNLETNTSILKNNNLNDDLLLNELYIKENSPEGFKKIFKELDWSNIIVAGGYVSAIIGHHKYVASDIDIFLYGMSEEKAIEKINYLVKFFHVDTETPYQYMRTNRTITIKLGSRTIGVEYHSRRRLPIQIILRIYDSPEEVLLGFDLNSVKCFYDGEKVMMTKLCYLAHLHHYNLADGDQQVFRTNSFERRLNRYLQRGFSIRIPGFDWKHVNATYLISRENSFGLELLLRKISGITIFDAENTVECYSVDRKLIETENESFMELEHQYLDNPFFIFGETYEDIEISDNWLERHMEKFRNIIENRMLKHLKPPNVTSKIQFIGSLQEYLRSLPPKSDWYGDILKKE